MRFTFLDGRPPGTCRPYTDGELQTLCAATLMGAEQAPATQPPDAVFVSGLPGSGKSSLAASLHAAGLSPLLPPRGCALIDDDALRGFHAQYASLASAPGGARYKELSPWFHDDSSYEEAIFRAPGGLLDAVMGGRRSFVQAANMHSAGSVSWVRHVIRRGYRAHFVLVHVPADVAVERAAARAAATGRWCPASYIESCASGMAQHSAEVWRACIASGGSALCVDNTADAPTRGSPPLEALACGALRISARLAYEYGLHEELRLRP